VRYPSFAALLEADVARLREQVDEESRAKAGVAAFVETVRNTSAPLGARFEAAWQAFGGGARSELVPALAGIALDRGQDTTDRQNALRLLGYIHDRPALDALVLASRDPEPRILALAIPPLAASDNPADREAAIAVLADPGTPSVVARSTDRPAGDAVWEAYCRSGNPALLPQLAYLGENRATDDVLAVLRDEDRLEEDQRDLVGYAYYLRDPRIARALAAFARRHPVWRTNVGSNLVSAGALDEAIPLLTEAMLAGDGFGQAEASLVRSRDARAGKALLRGLRERPTAANAGMLGWFPSPEAAAALGEVLDDPGLRLAAIEGLELMGTIEARDVLARLADAGNVLATRALARLRDTRAREPLLGWLGDTDPGLARTAADGLRNLRDPSTADALLGAASHADADVAVIAVHALLSMGSPRRRAGLIALGRHPDPRARALAARWTERLSAAPSGA
jgi:HEAT repeat protein